MTVSRLFLSLLVCAQLFGCTAAATTGPSANPAAPGESADASSAGGVDGPNDPRANATPEPDEASAPDETAAQTEAASGPTAATEAQLTDERNVKPGINDDYVEAKSAKSFVKRLEGEDREVFERRKAIVEAMALRRGATVADVGAGTGLFTVPFAKAVGEDGRVYAVDLSSTLLEHIGKRVKDAGLSNVELVQAGERSFNLPSNTIDFAFMCDVYHHLEFPMNALASLRQALRPGGELVVIDFELGPDADSWRKEHVRAGKDTFRKEIESAGFEFVEEHKGLLKDNYILRFRRR